MLAVGLTACGTAAHTAPPPPPRPPTTIPSPTPSPALEGVAATLLAASGTLHQASSSLGDASAAALAQLYDSAGSNGQDALAQVVGAREQLSRLKPPAPYVPAYRLLSQADAEYQTAANSYVRASGGNGSAVQAADHAASAGDSALQQADKALAARPETRLASVQAQAQNLIGVFPTSQSTAPRAAPKKPAVRKPVARKRPATRPRPAAAPTARPTPSPTPHPSTPKRRPTAKKRPSPTPTPTRVPRRHPSRVSRPRPTPTPGISPALLAQQRTTLRSILGDVQGAASRLKSIRTKLGGAATQPDFDPSALTTMKSHIDTTVISLQSVSQSTAALHPAQPLTGARDQLSTAVHSYAAAAGELGRVIHDIEAGDQATAKSDLSAADASLTQADAAFAAAQTAVSATP